MESDISSASLMSAELNGIIKYYNNQLVPNHDYHLLLCTDTWLDESIAKLVENWLKGDAKRIFGHYEGGAFVLDKLDRSLH